MRMDPTSAAACFMVDDEDDLLNFTLEDETLQQLDNTKDPSSSSFSSQHPECVEEELEWLSNKDAFPAIEFGILSDNQGLVFDHHSPVSVLENSSSTSNNSGNANGSAYMSCCASLKVPVNYPVRARSKRRRRRRRGDLTDVPIEHCLSVNPAGFKSAKQPQPQPQPLLLQPLNSARSANIGRRCQHCGVDKTPQWRAGPMGPKTLCNACGVRYKSGRLLPEYRPANSPTFSADLHSNSHRKVLEMRKLKTRVGGMMIHEACGYRPPWLIVDAEESFDVPIEHCLSVNQASFKNNKQQQPLLSLQMNSARSASIGRKYQDGGVDRTQKWQAGPLWPKTLCKACGALYKSVNQASVKNNNQQQPLLPLPRNSAKSASIGRRPINSAKSASIGRSCQDCGVEKTPKWLAGPLGPKTLCNACGVRYKLVIQMTFKNNNQQQPLVSLPVNFAKSDSIGRRCQDCGVDKTPKWLAGPLGPKTLCKACVVRYKSGRLLPEYFPANSPTTLGLIVEGEDFFDMPIEHCLSVNQASFKKTKQQQSLLSLSMNSAKSASIGRRCQHCGVNKTPQWRAGPLGQKTLCNACGVRYRSGRLFPEYRPANSPTFSAALHSNSHQKVLEMRKQIGVGKNDDS